MISAATGSRTMSETTTQDPTLTRVLSVIAKRVHPSLHHKIEEATSLRELQLTAIELWSITFDLETEFGTAFEPDPAPSWLTVGDVVDTVRSVEHG